MPVPPYPTFACAIGYDVDASCVVMTWKGYATSRQFRESNECIINAIAERNVCKLLGDIEEFVLIGADDQRWLTSDWIPRAIAVGLRAVALVAPIFDFNRVAGETVRQKLDPGRLIVQQFDTGDDARRWLAGL
jgi:hypothetical protein